MAAVQINSISSFMALDWLLKSNRLIPLLCLGVVPSAIIRRSVPTENSKRRLFNEIGFKLGLEILKIFSKQLLFNLNVYTKSSLFYWSNHHLYINNNYNFGANLMAL